MVILLALAALIAVPVFGFKGVAYRGAYLAGTVICALLGFIAHEMVNATIPNPTPAEARGAEFIDAFGFGFGVVMFATAIGCLIAAALYRPKA